MQIKRVLWCIVVILLVILLVVGVTACGGGAATATPDTEASVEAAVAATDTAQANLQATVDAAVQATAEAAPPTPTLPPSPTVSVSPEATSVPATEEYATEYVTMSEEELAALIDQAVAEAVAATQACSTATTEATADDTFTQEEVDAVEVYVMDADAAIAYAEELLYAYYDLYGELASESLELLAAIEDDLAVLAENVAAMTEMLEEINATLEQSLALAEETIAQIESTAQAIATQAEELHAQAQGWIQTVQAELENRVMAVQGIQPVAIPGDRQEAIRTAFDYVDAVRQALGDNKISQAELETIAQLGANASAGLDAHGGLQLQRLSGSIEDITGQIARGQLPQAQANLGNLEASLGPRPHR